MKSLIASAVRYKYGKILDQIYLKEEVLNHMRGDEIIENVSTLR